MRHNKCSYFIRFICWLFPILSIIRVSFSDFFYHVCDKISENNATRTKSRALVFPRETKGIRNLRGQNQYVWIEEVVICNRIYKRDM